MKQIPSSLRSRRTILLQLALIIGVAISAIAFQSYAAGTFNQPSVGAPGGNAYAPLNVGSKTQGRLGNLGIGILNPTAKYPKAKLVVENGDMLVSNGNVGIGTTNPTAKLDVNGTSLFRNNITVNQNWSPAQSLNINSDQIWKTLTTSGDNTLYLQWNNPNGNVQIGRPGGTASDLDVNGALEVAQNIGTRGFSPTAGIPTGWGGGIHTWDVYAEGTVGVGKNGQINAYLNNAGNIWAKNSISAPSIAANKICLNGNTGSACKTSWGGSSRGIVVGGGSTLQKLSPGQRNYNSSDPDSHPTCTNVWGNATCIKTIGYKAYFGWYILYDYNISCPAGSTRRQISFSNNFTSGGSWTLFNNRYNYLCINQ